MQTGNPDSTLYGSDRSPLVMVKLKLRETVECLLIGEKRKVVGEL